MEPRPRPIAWNHCFSCCVLLLSRCFSIFGRTQAPRDANLGDSYFEHPVMNHCANPTPDQPPCQSWSKVPFCMCSEKPHKHWENNFLDMCALRASTPDQTPYQSWSKVPRHRTTKPSGKGTDGNEEARSGANATPEPMRHLSKKKETTKNKTKCFQSLASQLSEGNALATLVF